jgi:hypothetical protein
MPSDEKPAADLPPEGKPEASMPPREGRKKPSAKRTRSDRRSNWLTTIINLMITVLIVASMVWLLFWLKQQTPQTRAPETPRARVADHKQEPRKVQPEAERTRTLTQKTDSIAPQQEMASAASAAGEASRRQPAAESVAASKPVSDQPASKAAEGRKTAKASPPPIRKIASRSKQVSSTRSVAIESLLENAEKNLKKYRLTTPERDCAYFYFKEVLRMDPRNSAARKGIVRIGDAYGRLAEREISRSEYEKAENYVNKGLEVVPRHSRLLALKKELDRPRSLRFFDDVGKKVKGLFE